MSIVVNFAPSEGAALTRIGQILGQFGGIQYVGMPQDGQAWRAMMQSVRDCSVFVTPVADAVQYTSSVLPALNYASSLGKPIVLVVTGPVSVGLPHPNPGDVLIDYRAPDAAVDARVVDAVRAGMQVTRSLPQPLPMEPADPTTSMAATSGGWPSSGPVPAGASMYPPQSASGSGGPSNRTWVPVAVIAAVLMIVAGAIGVAVALVRGSDGDTSGTASGTTTTAVTSTTAESLTGPDLEAALLTASELDPIMGVGNLEPLKTYGYPMSATMLAEPECDPVFSAGVGSLYDGTGYVSLRGGLTSAMEPVQVFVDQVATAFSTEEMAEGLIDAAAQRWGACADRVVSRISSDGQPTRWTVGPLDRQSERIESVLVQEGADGWSCRHVMSRRDAVVMEANVCGDNLADQADQIVDRVLDELAGA